MNIYVGNLPFDTTDDDLRDLFSKHGTVTSANIITDRDTERSKGFGFVEMDSDTDAKAAIKEYDGYELSSHGGAPRALRVNEARPREDRRSRTW